MRHVKGTFVIHMSWVGTRDSTQCWAKNPLTYSTYKNWCNEPDSQRQSPDLELRWVGIRTPTTQMSTKFCPNHYFKKTWQLFFGFSQWFSSVVNILKKTNNAARRNSKKRLCFVLLFNLENFMLHQSVLWGLKQTVASSLNYRVEKLRSVDTDCGRRIVASKTFNCACYLTMKQVNLCRLITVVTSTSNETFEI